MGAIRYRFDMLEALKEKGWSTYRILKAPVEERPFGQSTVQKLRKGDTSLTLANLAKLCELLEKQPGDLLEYVPDDDRPTGEQKSE